MMTMAMSRTTCPPGAPVIGRRATIDDVARAAGVSRQTVSNVVRGRGRLASATRDRVLAAIEELGYKPHTGAASLRSGRTYRIAYPIPDAELHPGNVIMLEFLQFLVAAARERKHQVLVTGSYGNGLEAIEDLVWTKSVDGFVLATMADDDPRVAFLAERQVPFACFGRTSPAMPQHWVDIDNRAAIRDITARVLDLRAHQRQLPRLHPAGRVGRRTGGRLPGRHDRGRPAGDRDPDRDGPGGGRRHRRGPAQVTGPAHGRHRRQ